MSCHQTKAVGASSLTLPARIRGATNKDSETLVGVVGGGVGWSLVVVDEECPVD